MSRRPSPALALLTCFGALACAVFAPSAPPTAAPVASAATATEPGPATSAPAPSPTPAPAAASFRIVGYVTDWDVVVEDIPYAQLTHLNYAFLAPDGNGTWVAPAHMDKLQAIVSAAHAHGVKVLIAVGGWGWDAQFEELAALPSARSHFATTLLQFVADYDLDGIDMDWEYPGPALGSADSYVQLMRELSRGLRAEGRLLTAAVVASDWAGAGIKAEVFALVDFLNIMAYDGPDTNHASLEYAQAALAYWRGRGLPPEQMVLGVPFYSRPSEAPYHALLAADPAAADQDALDYQGITVYYNGRPTLAAKVALAQREASGLMIWALTHDAPGPHSLLSAIVAAAER